jgi:radical SAM protein with 4Fe4S-binding SPASM domain
MAWFTEYLQPSRAPALRCQDEYPYVTALLRTPPHLAEIAIRRLNNLRAVREAERTMKAEVSGLPYHVVLDPSNVCNLRCPLCVQETDPLGRHRTMIALDDYRLLLDTLAPSVIRLDLFNWGEPLLHPSFPELVSLAAAQGIYTRTSSNMSLPKGIQCDMLIDAGLQYLVASVDGASQSTYELYRVGGDLNTVLKNLRALVQARERRGVRHPVIEWQYLALNHNAGEIDRARQMASDIGVDVFRYGGARGRMSTKVLTATPDNVVESSEFLLPPGSSLSEYDQQGNKVRKQEYSRCRWLWGKIALHPDGGCAPCWSTWFERFDMGNWRTDGIAAVWNNATYRAARKTANNNGKSDGDLVCDRCAFNRSFVPTPDGDAEPPVDAGILRAVTAALNDAGIDVSPYVVDSLCASVQELLPASGQSANAFLPTCFV